MTTPKPHNSLTVSFVFLIIAVLGAIPMYDAIANPQDGMGQMGRGLGGFFGIICISIPASFVSLLCGLATISESKLAYIPVIPTSIFLLYCGYILMRIVQ